LTDEKITPPPFFSGVSPAVLRGAFIIASIAALAVTPIQAGFALREALSCELTPALHEWIPSIANVRHLVAYTILTILAVLSLRGRPLWQPVAIVLALTIGVEIEQAIFADGHCRLRDMLPNVIALAMGAAIGALIGVWTQPKRG
jgi:O-antigen ligase